MMRIPLWLAVTTIVGAVGGTLWFLWWSVFKMGRTSKPSQNR